jgi:putative transposase
VLNWIPIFGNPEVVRMVLDSLRFLIGHRRLTIHGWVIMENHLHLVASSDDLSKQIHDFKSFTARSIIDYLIANHVDGLLGQFKLFKKEHKIHQDYQFWQEGSHPEMILNVNMLNEKLNYIHDNPVRRGYVEDPAHWRYSSFIDYHGGVGLLPVEMIDSL